LLVGNFGDGNINVYDKNGLFIGKIIDQAGNVAMIQGLLGLIAMNDRKNCFSSGSNDETDGIVGECKQIACKTFE
jgi:hypothetical protein